MNSYTIHVLTDDDTEPSVTFQVITDNPIDKRLLQLVGMILDNGISPETICHEVPTAQACVRIEGGYTRNQKWVDEALGGNKTV